MAAVIAAMTLVACGSGNDGTTPASGGAGKEAIEIAGSLLANQKTSYEGKSIETAGEVADGWVLSVMEPPAYVQRGLELLGKGAPTSASWVSAQSARSRASSSPERAVRTTVATRTAPSAAARGHASPTP